jgi:sugar diacid utilization regulator
MERERDGRCVLLVQDNAEAIEQWVAELDAQTDLDLLAGIGRLISSPQDIGHSWDDAALALHLLSQPRSSSKTLAFEQFDLSASLLANAEHSGTKLQADHILNGLRANKLYWEALLAYLSCDLNVQRAAQQLYLHPNTLRYRLQRVEEVYGHRLSSVRALVNLSLALDFELSDCRADSGSLATPPTQHLR